MTQGELTQILIERTKENLSFGESLRGLDKEIISKKPASGGWSVEECLEHLSLYGDYYHDKFLKNGRKTGGSFSQRAFKPGILGNYFAKSMLPKEGMKTMKTFNDKDPGELGLPSGVLDRFIGQQSELLKFLEECNELDLNSNRIPITIAKWIKLKLGDALHFVVNHNVRHIEQAKKIIDQK